MALCTVYNYLNLKYRVSTKSGYIGDKHMLLEKKQFYLIIMSRNLFRQSFFRLSSLDRAIRSGDENYINK